jgi:hypothetical protein
MDFFYPTLLNMRCYHESVVLKDGLGCTTIRARVAENIPFVNYW